MDFFPSIIIDQLSSNPILCFAFFRDEGLQAADEETCQTAQVRGRNQDIAARMASGYLKGMGHCVSRDETLTYHHFMALLTADFCAYNHHSPLTVRAKITQKLCVEENAQAQAKFHS